MKKVLMLLAVTAWVAAGCQSSGGGNSSSSNSMNPPAAQNSPALPSPNTINNPVPAAGVTSTNPP
jgi:hypothetical protein